MDDETCKVFKNEKEVATANFSFDNTQILVSSVDTLEKYQIRGYGRLLFGALFLLAQQKKMPLILDSLDNAVPFYEKMGMLHLNDPEVQKRIQFGNIDKKHRIEKIDNDDFIWIPRHIRKKPIIFL